MTNDRYADVDSERSRLTSAEIAVGWHFCAEWDGLLIGPGMGELAACSCFPEGDVRRLECQRMAAQHAADMDDLDIGP